MKDFGRNGFGVLSKPSSASEQSTATQDQVPTVRLTEGGRPIRTIILPAGPTGISSSSSSSSNSLPSISPGHADALAMQCDSLKRQLGDIQRLADERATAYGRDRDTLIDQYERKIGADSAALRQLESQLEAAQGKLTQLTKDFLSQRAQYSSTERALREQMAEDRAARELAERELSMTSSQTEAQLASMHAQLDASIKNARSQLVSKAEQHNDSIRMLTTQWEGEKAALTEQVATLKDQLKFQKQKNIALDKRRSGEAEGFMHDISQLRRALRQLETQWAIMGNAVSENAMAENVREMEAHAAEIAARLSQYDGQETVGQPNPHSIGRDWLPSRSVNQPALSGIRPGVSLGINKQQKTRVSPNSPPLAPSPPQKGGSGFKYNETANRRVKSTVRVTQKGNNTESSPQKLAPVATQTSFSAQSPQHSHLGGRGGGGSFMSPGAAMDLVDSPPPSALRRAQIVAQAARAQLEEEQGGTEDDSLELLLRKREEHMHRQSLPGEDDGEEQEEEEEEEEEEVEEEQERSRSARISSRSNSTMSAKRVPASAPNAAPRVDPTVARRTDDVISISSPGHAAAEKSISATAKMRSQLEILQDKIVSTSEKMQRVEERS
jgi:hypothetical protein